VEFDFDGALYLSNPEKTGAWTMIGLPNDLADEIGEVAGPISRGFGSVRVLATIGDTTWRTSVFPDGGLRTYTLPVNEHVRRTEGVDRGDTAHVHIELVDL
jgi:hypothetical protein